MNLRGMIFDIDGTLVDTNPAHVEAWRRAFKRLGYDVPVKRIKVEIGKGGDLLVPSILGEEVEDRQGEVLRKVFQALRQRGIRTALATSSNRKHLQAICDSAGIDLPSLADVLVTKEEAEASKPSPDLVIVAWEKLALTPAECAMVGDTVYDAQACRGAAVVFLGVLSGGTPAELLLEAGACGVWRDTGHLYADLDHALELASLAAAASR